MEPGNYGSIHPARERIGALVATAQGDQVRLVLMPLVHRTEFLVVTGFFAQEPILEDLKVARVRGTEAEELRLLEKGFICSILSFCQLL